MTSLFSRGTLIIGAALTFASTAPAFAQLVDTEASGTSLFKVVTVKDEIVIGFTENELDTLGGRDAGAVARALVTRGELTAWQYGVRKAASGELEQAPRQKVGVLAHESIRVEPYPTPLSVLAHE